MREGFGYIISASWLLIRLPFRISVDYCGPIDGQEEAVERGTNDDAEDSHNEYGCGVGQQCDHRMYPGAPLGQMRANYVLW